MRSFFLEGLALTDGIKGLYSNKFTIDPSRTRDPGDQLSVVTVETKRNISNKKGPLVMTASAALRILELALQFKFDDLGAGPNRYFLAVDYKFIRCFYINLICTG